MATSSHQSEGAAGRPSSTWARWEALGHVRAGNRSGIACDWWESAERDFDLARDLGLNALRMTVDWARVEPQLGRFDDGALARYREMVVALRERGIEPIVTLHHFDHPVWFEDLGGFANPRLGGALPALRAPRGGRARRRVLGWVTFNEPNVYATAGYVLGDFPPGRRGDTLERDTRAGQHGPRPRAAYRLIHEQVAGAFVSFVQHLLTFAPFRPAHIQATAGRARFSDRMFNAPFLELARDGRTSGPPGLRIDRPRDEGALDFIGINLYGRRRARFSLRSWRSAFNSPAPPPPAARRGDPGAEEKFGRALAAGHHRRSWSVSRTSASRC